MANLISTIVPFFTTITIAIATTCLRGTYKSENQCTQCSPGTFQDQLNATSCRPCRGGTSLPFSGAQSERACVGCPEDTFSAAGAAYCTPCPPGTISNGNGKRCAACAPGTYFSDSDLPGALLCPPCQPGTFSTRNNSSSCTRCPPGSTSPAGATSGLQCTPCPPGTVIQGYVNCTTCPPDLYYNAGRKECRQCEVGTNLTENGCQPCEPGYFGKYVSRQYFGEPQCLRCPENFTTYAPGATQCRRIGGRCPKGFETTRFGDCIVCPADFRYNAFSGRCTPCPIGTGSDGGTASQCTPCVQLLEHGLRSSNASHFADTVLMGNCRSVFFGLVTRSDRPSVSAFPKQKNPCGPGSRAIPGFPKLCVKCNPNTFSNTSDALQCTPCPLTHFARGSGSTECTPCPEGSQRLKQNSYTCIVPQTTCPAGDVYGKFGCEPDCGNNGTKSVYDIKGTTPCGRSIFSFFNCTGCETCPNGFVRGHFKNTKCSCSGWLAETRGMVNGSCVECPPGSYGARPNVEGNVMENNICKPCPGGTFARAISIEELDSRIENTKSDSQPVCLPCPVNAISQPGSTKCEECPPGTFSYGLGETECIPLGR